MGEVTFTVDDGEELAQGTLPALVARAIDYLDKLPAGKLVTTMKLAADLGVMQSTLAAAAPHPAMSPYRITAPWKGRKRTLLGSRETITVYAEAHRER